MSKVDTVVAPEKWVFDEEVADVFDDMLARSIPQYDVMRATTNALVARALRSYFRRTESDAPPRVVDLGTSRGEAIAPLLRAFVDHERFDATLVESSRAMYEAVSRRFVDDHSFRVDIRHHDLRDGLPDVGGDVVAFLSVLTLMFVPINYRAALVAEMYERLVDGGVVVLVEKVLGASSVLDETFVDEYHALKGRNGYDTESIAGKARSLEGVLVPVTARWNEELLRQGGFRHVDCFWRWMNFAGFLAIK